MEKYFSSLSIVELLHIMRGCQNRYNEKKTCDDCTYFQRGYCDGKREEDEDKFQQDLLMEQMEQM